MAVGDNVNDERAAVLLGGVGTVVVALVWMKLFPTLRNVERLEGDQALTTGGLAASPDS